MPDPVIRYYVNISLITDRGDVVLMPAGELIFLMVKPKVDEGTYQCVAKNSQGQATSRNATLRVACKWFGVKHALPLFQIY